MAVIFFTLQPTIEQESHNTLRSVKPRTPSASGLSGRQIVPGYVRLYELAAVLRARRTEAIAVARATSELRQSVLLATSSVHAKK